MAEQTQIATLISRFRDDPRRRSRNIAFHTFAPAPRAAVLERFRPYSDLVPADLLDFFSHTNGLIIGAFRIASLNEIYWPEVSTAALHFWGNGDIDGAVIEPGARESPIVFLGHDPPWRFQVASGMYAWLQAVFEELVQFGAVLHPWDCYTNKVKRLYCKPSQ